jgi:hypothetical protein
MWCVWPAVCQHPPSIPLAQEVEELENGDGEDDDVDVPLPALQC